MKRKDLRIICKQIAEELADRPYVYWKDIKFPYSFIEQRSGAELQIEIVLLEDKPEFFQFSVSISDGNWMRDYMPVGQCFIVQKTPDSKTKVGG